MEYVYKEPETWDDLFDALDALGEGRVLPICKDVREFFRRPRAPKNLTAAWKRLKSKPRPGRWNMTLGHHVRAWCSNLGDFPKDIQYDFCRWLYPNNALPCTVGPPPDIEPFREYLREKLREAARRFPPKN